MTDRRAVRPPATAKCLSAVQCVGKRLAIWDQLPPKGEPMWPKTCRQILGSPTRAVPREPQLSLGSCRLLLTQQTYSPISGLVAAASVIIGLAKDSAVTAVVEASRRFRFRAQLPYTSGQRPGPLSHNNILSSIGLIQHL